MWALIIKNNTGSSIIVEDLGIPVPSAGQIDFSTQFTYDEIAGSDDLRTEVVAGNLVVNDGTSDLSSSEGEKYLKLYNIAAAEDNFYTQTQLSSGGESQVHWENITDVPDSVEDRNTLDEAYDEGGPGAGRTIVTDSGSLQLSAAGGYAPLELTDLPSPPSSGLGGGQIASIGGLLYSYDATRSKWLSIQRQTLVFGRKGGSKDQFLNFAAGTLPSNNSGFRVMRNATIVGLAGQLNATGTCDLMVRKNDLTANITTLNVSAALGAVDVTINTDLNAGDYLQSFLEATVKVTDPILIVEIAWRQ
jgi:hypothetical protein